MAKNRRQPATSAISNDLSPEEIAAAEAELEAELDGPGGAAEAKQDEPAPTTVWVNARSTHGKNPQDNIAYGHWRAGLHWPSSNTAREITLEQFDELAADPFIAMAYDQSKVDGARAEAARQAEKHDDLELEAARLEAAAAELRAKAAERQAEALRRGAAEAAANARVRVSALEAKKAR